MLDLKQIRGTELDGIGRDEHQSRTKRMLLVNSVANYYSEQVRSSPERRRGSRPDSAGGDDLRGSSRASRNWRRSWPRSGACTPTSAFAIGRTSRATRSDPYEPKSRPRRRQVNDYTTKIAGLTSQLDQVEKLKGEELMRALATLQIADPTVQTILPKYQEAVSERGAAAQFGPGPEPSEGQVPAGDARGVYQATDRSDRQHQAFAGHPVGHRQEHAGERDQATGRPARQAAQAPGRHDGLRPAQGRLHQGQGSCWRPRRSSMPRRKANTGDAVDSGPIIWNRGGTADRAQQPARAAEHGHRRGRRPDRRASAWRSSSSTSTRASRRWTTWKRCSACRCWPSCPRTSSCCTSSPTTCPTRRPTASCARTSSSTARAPTRTRSRWSAAARARANRRRCATWRSPARRAAIPC